MKSLKNTLVEKVLRENPITRDNRDLFYYTLCKEVAIQKNIDNERFKVFLGVLAEMPHRDTAIRSCAYYQNTLKMYQPSEDIKTMRNKFRSEVESFLKATRVTGITKKIITFFKNL